MTNMDKLRKTARLPMREPPCIDLKTEFGDTFRVVSEETRQPGQHWDSWLAQIRCRYGHIYVHGGDELGVSVDFGRVKITGMIRRLDCVRVIQDGDNGEVNAVFHRKDLDRVLAVMHPYRRKQFSEESLTKFRNHLAKANASRLSRDRAGLDPELGRSETQVDKMPVQSRNERHAAQGGLYADT
jgi:hypothetical protein